MDELPWIERTVTRARVSMWRSAANGMHYESETPRDFGDIEVSHRAVVTVSGTLLGEYPDLGLVTYRADAPSITTVEDMAG